MMDRINTIAVPPSMRHPSAVFHPMARNGFRMKDRNKIPEHFVRLELLTIPDHMHDDDPAMNYDEFL